MTDVNLALYRKYRPTTFKEVRNQEHIVSVLEGALSRKDMIPHALLFTGPRGTGKTTVARIFAREVGADDIDVYEIDAASNRSIDDVRELKEAVHTLPYRSPYKVYIIDEVHMLTKEAFNALLKTLEEPPKHVIFILATTERDKLLDTITSRCQVFEFHAPTREELRETVLSIAKKEKFKLEKDVADVIALAADGSYRDALGITQKVMMASGDSELSEEEVANIIGAPRSVMLRGLLQAFVDKNVDGGLAVLASANAGHLDMKLFHRLFLDRIRTVMLLKHQKSNRDKHLEGFGEEDREHLLALAESAETSLNSQFLMKTLEIGPYIGKSSIPALPFELLLLEHCSA